MFGFLNVNKPPGWTSRDVVNRIQTLVRPTKVGHAGTLDPLATGVLVVCLGPATRLVPYVQQMTKRYVATFLLGRHSDTDDVDGKVIEDHSARRVARAELLEILPRFIGEIPQRPPAYAAVKVRGRRAYELARRGEKVELSERPVRIEDLTLTAFDYPEFQLDIRCGSGTYVRALGRDIAAALDTTAVMSQLVRTAIGGFRYEDAVELDKLTADHLRDWLLPASRGVEHLPRITVDQAELTRLRSGLAIIRPTQDHQAEYAALDVHGELLAILAPQGSNKLRPVRNFVPAKTPTD